MIICTVCRGNLHRSPVAAAALQRALGDPATMVRSAGLAVTSGRPSPPDLVAAAAESGLDLASHRARALDVNEPADLYLPMTRQQARQLVVDHPWTSGRVVPYGELAQLLAREVRHGDLAAAVARRTPERLLGVSSSDIADPPHDSLKVHRALVSRIVAVADEISSGWARVR